MELMIALSLLRFFYNERTPLINILLRDSLAQVRGLSELCLLPGKSYPEGSTILNPTEAPRSLGGNIDCRSCLSTCTRACYQHSTC